MILVTRVLNFWGKHLFDHGVISSFTPFSEPQPAEMVKISRNKATSLAMESMEGVRFKGLSMQFLMHDPIKGGNFPPPVPLKRVQMKVYKRPPVVLSLTFKNTEPGEENTRSYEISAEEDAEFKSLISPDTKCAFINGIVSSRTPVSPKEVSGEVAL